MPEYVWNADWETGDKTIDTQHQGLLELANLLHEAARRGGEKSASKAAFQALVRYTEKHFADEEKFFESVGSPDLDDHRQQHRMLKEELDKLWTNETLAFVETIGDELRKWMVGRLVPHMVNVDQAAMRKARAKG